MREKYQIFFFQSQTPVSTVSKSNMTSLPSQQPRTATTEGSTFPCRTEKILVQEQVLGMVWSWCLSEMRSLELPDSLDSPLVNLLIYVYNKKSKHLAPDVTWMVSLRKGTISLQAVQRLERLVEFIENGMIYRTFSPPSYTQGTQTCAFNPRL